MRNFIICCLLLLAGSAIWSQTVVLPTGFAFQENFVTGLDQPTDLRFAPDGRIFITEKTGKVRIVENNVLLQQPFYEVLTQTPYERGLDGIVLDPDFDQNGYVYLYYTLPFENRNRVIRVTAVGNTALPGSEVELIRLDELYAAFHNGGSMVFDTTGCLIIGVGDGTGWFIAQNNQVLMGKMLRINRDGSIPADNPFYNQFQGRERAIAAYGIRNPYTMDISRTTGRILFNDVGNELFEEINEYHPQANYGWGLVEGMLGSGIPPDSNYMDPVHAYDHQFGCAVVGAAFYEPLVSVFPPEYFGKYFFIEYCKGLVMYLDPDNHSVTQFASGLGTYYNNIETGPDGALYLINVMNGNVARISYQGLNAAPLISVQPSAVTVPKFRRVSFNVIANGYGLQYDWFRDGNLVQSGPTDSLVLKSVTLADNGARFFVRVSNAHGFIASDTVTLSVIDGTPPQVTFLGIPATYSAGDTLRFGANVVDAEQSAVPVEDWTWQVVFHHDEHGHPTTSPTSGIAADSFVVENFGEVDTNVFFRIHLTAIDSSGLVTHATQDILPELVTMQFESIPEGVEINIDGTHSATNFSQRSLRNQSRTAEVPFASVVGDSLYQFIEWWDGEDTLRRTFAADNGEFAARYVAVERYFSGIPDSGSLEYFKDTASTQVWYARKNVAQIKENWDIVSPFWWDQQFPQTNWSTRWTGWIYAPVSDTYSFFLRHDGKVALSFDSVLVHQNTFPWPIVGIDTFQVDLEGGRLYWLRLDYDHGRDVARVELDWEYSIVERHTVPFMKPSPIVPPVIPFDYGDIVLFPNPVTGESVNFWVDPNNFGSAAVTVRIYDLSGKLCYQQVGRPSDGMQTLTMAGFAPGIYVARITVGIREQVVRLMKL